MGEQTIQKPAKVFVSHSSQDLMFVKPLVEMLAYIGLSTENMFCSSVPGYNVPLNSNIYDYLLEQFQKYNLLVIFVLSENYYNSPASLNEMGAAWALHHKYTFVLVPQFNYKDIRGVIDHMRISIKLDSDKGELKSRLNELREILITEFGLSRSVSAQNAWETYRDAFVEKMSSTDLYWKKIRELREKNRPLEEWIYPLRQLIEINPSSYDAMYMLGTIFAELKDMDKAVKYLKMAARLSNSSELREKANIKLRSIGYVV